MKIYNNILETIGSTPLVKINKLTGGNVFAKLEYFNPAGSIKDRAALNMILGAEKRGLIKKDTEIIEPTSGNTGIGLAYVGSQIGVKTVIVMPDNMSLERRQMIANYGAQLVLTPAAEGMEGAVKKARELESEGFYFINQFANEGNIEAHFETTAPEVFKAIPDAICIVAGIGSGGTVMGFKKYIKANGLKCKVVGVEPKSSPLLTKGYAGPHKIQGIGANFVPSILDKSEVDLILPISDEDAFDYVKWFYKTSGEKVGISSGATLAAAELISERTNGKIVAILADGGDRYSDELYE